MYLNVKTDGYAEDDIVISNILVSDADANEYWIPDSRSHRGNESGVELNPGYDRISIEASDNKITIRNAKGHDVLIYSINGTLIMGICIDSDIESVAISKGVYLVKVADEIKKVIVK